MISLFSSMIRAIRLDSEIYEEIPVNHNYIYHSIVIIILSSISAGIARYPGSGTAGFILVTLIALFCWILWGYLTFFIANLLMDANDQSIDFKEVIRITGFASAPGLIRALGMIPGFFGIVFFISWVWMVIMMATSVKHAFDLSLLNALGVSLIGGLVQAGILALFL